MTNFEENNSIKNQPFFISIVRCRKWKKCMKQKTSFWNTIAKRMLIEQEKKSSWLFCHIRPLILSLDEKVPKNKLMNRRIMFKVKRYRSHLCTYVMNYCFFNDVSIHDITGICKSIVVAFHALHILLHATFLNFICSKWLLCLPKKTLMAQYHKKVWVGNILKAADYVKLYAPWI